MNEQLYLNIKNGLLFPVQFHILGYVLLFAGSAFIVINFWVSIILILIGGLIVSAYSGTEFKGDNFRAYNAFFLFYKSGKWEPLKQAEKIFIKRVKLSQKFYGRANQSSTISNIKLKAFLKFKDGNTILLFEHKKQQKVQDIAKAVADHFNVEIVDHSS